METGKRENQTLPIPGPAPGGCRHTSASPYPTARTATWERAVSACWEGFSEISIEHEISVREKSSIRMGGSLWGKEF